MPPSNKKVAKLLRFSYGNYEYIVLSNGDEPDEDYARPGFKLSGAYTLDELAEDDEWPTCLPTDRELEA